VQFIKDFGDTTALMLTVASPVVNDVEVQLRAASIQRGIESTRAQAAPDAKKRASLAYAFPATLNPHGLRRVVQDMAKFAEEQGIASDARVFEGAGFVGIDAATDRNEEQIREGALRFLQEKLRTSELHPDVWRAIVVFDPKETEPKLRAV